MNKKINTILILAALGALAAGCGKQIIGDMSESYEGRTKIIVESSAYSSDNAVLSLGFGGFNFTTYSTIKMTTDSPLPDCNLEIGGQIEDAKPNYFVSGTSAFKGDINDGSGCVGEVGNKKMTPVEITGGRIELDKKSGDVSLIVNYKPRDAEETTNYEMLMTAHQKGWF